MMNKGSPRNNLNASKKTVADKRADFELAQDTIK